MIPKNKTTGSETEAVWNIFSFSMGVSFKQGGLVWLLLPTCAWVVDRRGCLERHSDFEKNICHIFEYFGNHHTTPFPVVYLHVTQLKLQLILMEPKQVMIWSLLNSKSKPKKQATKPPKNNVIWSHLSDVLKKLSQSYLFSKCLRCSIPME